MLEYKKEYRGAFMKKIWLILISVVIVVMINFMYQQNQLVTDYRSLLYGEMEVLNVPIERILAFQQEAESYNETERNNKLNQLNESYADFFNYTGSGLQLEPAIREKYYLTYSDTKLAYYQIIERYLEATTAEERERAYEDLKKKYEEYQQFLQTAKKELVEPI